MDGIRTAAGSPNPARRFREQAGEQRTDESVDMGPEADTPLEIHMTDEPGGDPYNHTGRFKRMFR